MTCATVNIDKYISISDIIIIGNSFNGKFQYKNPFDYSYIHIWIMLISVHIHIPIYFSQK